MRISTRGAFEQGVTAMRELQVALDRTQRQVSSGRRILTPSDDPISASRALELRERLARLTQFDRNSTIAKNRLQNEEAALSNVNNLLQRVRELTLQAGSGTQSDETRRMIATELRQNLDQLVQLANSKDGSGRFLFSGNLDTTTPVSKMGTSFAYNGDQGQRSIQIGESRRIVDGDSGDDVFFRIRAGNGVFVAAPAETNAGAGVIGVTTVVDVTQYDSAPYTVRFVSPTDYEVVDAASTVIATGTHQPGSYIGFRGIEFYLDGQPAAGDEFNVAPSPYQDVFTSVQKLIEAIERPVVDNASRAVLNNGINAGLQDIDQAIGKILDVRTQVGSRLAAIDNQTDANASFALTVQETLGTLEDLDYAEALSRLSFELTTLEAAQRSFIATQGLSLFKFL